MTTGIDQKFAMMKYCIPADISVIPLSDSNLIMYVADVYGQIWRIRYDFVARIRELDREESVSQRIQGPP